MYKSAEIRSWTPDEREERLKEVSDELFRERGIASMGGAPSNPGRIRALRTELARILTIIREEEGKR
jgi:large subunit ribosomal protein L29